MISSITPILVSSDINETERFFENTLSFHTEKKHENYLIVKNGEIEIHFSELSKVSKKKNNCACYLRVDNLDELYEKCKELDCVHPNGKLEEYPWGREFSVLDPDWNLVKIVGK